MFKNCSMLSGPSNKTRMARCQTMEVLFVPHFVAVPPVINPLICSKCFGDRETLRAQRLKKFNLDWNFQSRLKISISIENFKPDLQNFPQKLGVCWAARLKISISIENFNPGGRSWSFSIFGPLGKGGVKTYRTLEAGNSPRKLALESLDFWPRNWGLSKNLCRKGSNSGTPENSKLSPPPLLFGDLTPPIPVSKFRSEKTA